MKKTSLIIFFGLLLLLLPARDIKSQEMSGSFQFGVTQYRSGDYDKASKIMDKLLQIEPENYYAHYYMAMSLVKLKQFDEAKEHYLKIITGSTDKSLIGYAQKGLKLLDPDYYEKHKNSVAVIESNSAENTNVPVNESPEQNNTSQNTPASSSTLSQQRMIYEIAQRNRIDPVELNNLIQMLAKNPAAIKTMTQMSASNPNNQQFDPQAMAKYAQMMANKSMIDMLGNFSNKSDDDKKNSNDDFMGMMGNMNNINMMNMMNASKNSPQNMEMMMNQFTGNGQNTMNPEMLNQMFMQNMMQNTNGF